MKGYYSKFNLNEKQLRELENAYLDFYEIKSIFEETKTEFLSYILTTYKHHEKIKEKSKEFIKEDENLTTKTILVEKYNIDIFKNVDYEKEKETGHKKLDEEKESNHDNTSCSSNKQDIPKKQQQLLKKIFNKIAVHTHPDKCQNPDKAYLFEISKKAFDCGKLTKLLFIAKYIDAKDCFKYKDEAETEINEAIKRKKKKVTQYKQSLPMMWKTGDDELRKKIEEQFISSM